MEATISKSEVSVLSYLKTVGAQFVDLEVTRMAASLAFYVALSFAPLALLFIAASSALSPGMERTFTEQIGSLAGPGAQSMFKEVVDRSQNSPRASSISGLIGITWLLISASIVFGDLRSSLNKIFGIKPLSSDETLLQSALTFLRERVAHVGLLLSFIFLLMVSLVLSTFLSAIEFSGELVIAGLFNFLVSWTLYAGAFTLMVRYVPDEKQPWKQSLKGGCLIALLFALGKELIGLYMGTSALGSSYGAAGSAIVFLAWIYYSATVVFFGAVATRNLDGVHEFESR